MIINGSAITFLMLNWSDAGSYQCNATNPYGTIISPSVSLTVIEGIEFIAAPNSVVYLHEGDPASFTCKVTGKPVPTIEWYKSYSQEDPTIINTTTSRRTISNLRGSGYAWSQVNFTRVEVSDHGLYDCRANQLNESSSRLFELVIYATPRIAYENGREIEIRIGNSVTFFCNATGFPPPTYTWYKDGRDIMVNSRVTESRGILTILRTVGSDTGNYTCGAVNSVGHTTSQGSYLFIKGLYFIQEPPSEAHLSLNQSIVLNCSVGGSKSQVSIQWFKNNVKLRTECKQFQTHKLENCHLFINDTDLHIMRVTENQVGNYSCVAKEMGVNYEPEIIRKSTHVLIVERPSFVPLLPRIVEGDFHRSLTVECFVAGVPRPTITWLKDGFQLYNDSNRIVSDGLLIIKRLNIRDNGHYICIAQNSAGEARQQIRVKVNTAPLALNVTIKAKNTSATIGWTIISDGGYPLVGVTMELREVQPTLTQWMTIDTDIVTEVGEYHLEHLVQNASYEFSIWARNKLGPGEVFEVGFQTGPQASNVNVPGKNNTNFSSHVTNHSLVFVFVVIGAVGFGLILAAFGLFLYVTRFHHFAGDSDDGRVLVDNLQEYSSSNSNPVFGEKERPSSTVNGLELHDIKLDENATPVANANGGVVEN